MSARWLAQPLVHFVAIGGLLFALDRLAQDEQAEPAITITPERIAELREDWLARAGRLPSAAELEALVEREVDEELLLREARRLGFQRSDPLVRRRLVQNMRFVSSDDGGDPDTLLSQALALGMDRKDLVVRRRLVQKMELGAFAAARTREPSEPELREFLARYPERFSEPARVRLSHVYLSRDRRGDELGAASRRLLARLADGYPSPERAPALGDPFLAGHDLPLLSERELLQYIHSSDF